MKKNMGLVDRLVRLFAAVTVGVLYFTGVISGTAAVVTGIAAIVFLLTSFTGRCPLYVPLKISTCKKP